jgi:carbohydrate-selective porin OprB
MRTTTIGLCLCTTIVAQQEPAPGTANSDTTPAQVDEPTRVREWFGGEPIWRWQRITGDWFGLRNTLEDAGIEFGGGYTSDYTSAWSGDVPRHSYYISLTDVNVAFDLEQLLGLPRTTAYVDAYRIDGPNPSAPGEVGDFQYFSNLANTPTLQQIAETWLETWFFDQLRVKVGKVDFNSEFSFHEIGAEFVNSSAAIAPTIVYYPTYPNPAMSVNAFWMPTDRFYVGVGIYDGANAYAVQTGRRGPRGFFTNQDAGRDAYFLAGETGLGWAGKDRWGSGRISVGMYQHTATFNRFDGGVDQGTQGVWANLEQRVWRENPTEADDNQGLGFFAGYGVADPQVSLCFHSVTGGIEWHGAIPGRDFDVLGFGVFFADMSNVPGAGTPKNELELEAFYKIQLTPSLSIKPELQWIANAGGQDVADVLVGLLRFDVNF